MLNRVQSKYILDKIFENIRNKRKWNIVKYNKRIRDRLDIDKKIFEEYLILKEFNMKYDLNIDDFDIKELNIRRKYIRNEGFKYLSKLDFKELINLDLSENEILIYTDKLKGVNYQKLRELYLNVINFLEKENLKQLEKLNLSHNKIFNIDILAKVNFKELKELDLSYNEISIINILEKVNFKELKELYLGNNNISDINV